MGIDAVAQLLALGFFVAGFAGVALVVAAATQGRSVRRGILVAILGIVGGIVFLVVSEGLLVVGPTQRAVVFNNITGELEPPREPGINIILPGIQQTTLYSVSRQEYTMSGIQGEGAQRDNDAIEARSRDGQEVFVDLTIIYTIDPVNVNTVHRNWSDSTQGFVQGLIRPQVRSITRDVIALAEAEQIFGSTVEVDSELDDENAETPEETPEEAEATFGDLQSREDVQAEIERRVRVELEREGFTVIDLLLREINFSQDFINAIEQRQVAELERDRSAIVAEQVRIEAEGQAQATIERARGDAQAIRINAEAEAEALRLVSEQIAANPNLIQYEYINQLGDNVQLALIPSNSPFLFDFNSFTDVGEGFAAPENSTRENDTPTPNTSTDADTGTNSGD